MKIDCISDIDALEKIKDNWEKIYSRDAKATVFSSYAWMSAWIKKNKDPWCVLSFKDEAEDTYSAFLVLGCKGQKIYMGGNRMADYTNFLCLPEIEEIAVKSFAQYILKKMKWLTLEFRDVLDPRLKIFANVFRNNKCDVSIEKDIVCPYIELPPDWQTYLDKVISKKIRKKIKRCNKKALNGDFRFEYINDKNYVEQIDIVHSIWEKRWFDNGDNGKRQRKEIFRSCYLMKKLWSVVIYYGQTPVAGNLCFIEGKNKTLSAYISGYEDEYKKYSLGTVTETLAIKYAIENKYEIYDFLRGGESYKYWYGAKNKYNYKLYVERKNLKSLLSRYKNSFVYKLNKVMKK